MKKLIILTAIAILMAVTVFAGLACLIPRARLAGASHWDLSMLSLPANEHQSWYGRIGFWWLLTALIMGAIYWTFW